MRRQRAIERQNVSSLLETLVSPLSGGTESCQGVTTDVLQGLQSIVRYEVNISVIETPKTQLCAVSYKNPPRNPRNQEDGISIVVPARIFGQKIRALIDSGATRSSIYPAGVTKCGLNIEADNIFLELDDGKNCCHWDELSKYLSSQPVIQYKQI